MALVTAIGEPPGLRAAGRAARTIAIWAAAGR